MGSKRRRFVSRILALFVGLVLALAVGEILATGYALLRYGTTSVSELHALEKGNTFVTDSDNPYLKTLFPHPYLGFVHNKRFGGTRVNNIGLFGGRDMPLERRPDHFTILVIGGSVAAQFAQPYPDGERALEDILNERYDFGDKRATVLNGADGAWKHPQQLIMLSLYGDVVDAVISLEGFNELDPLSGSYRLEIPANNFHRVNPVLETGGEDLAAAAMSATLYDRSRESSWIGASRMLYFATALGRRTMVSWLRPSESQQDDITSVESIYALPAEWNSDRRLDYNLESYEKYLRLTDRVAQELGLRRAFFLQPVPAVNKPLTEEEKRGLGAMGVEYGPRYEAMVARLLRLRDEGVPVFSLLDVFENQERTIYGDAIHCRIDLPRHGSTGYRIMAERIADELEQAWELTRK